MGWLTPNRHLVVLAVGVVACCSPLPSAQPGRGTLTQINALRGNEH